MSSIKLFALTASFFTLSTAYALSDSQVNGVKRQWQSLAKKSNLKDDAVQTNIESYLRDAEITITKLEVEHERQQKGIEGIDKRLKAAEARRTFFSELATNNEVEKFVKGEVKADAAVAQLGTLFDVTYVTPPNDSGSQMQVPTRAIDQLVEGAITGDPKLSTQRVKTNGLFDLEVKAEKGNSPEEVKASLVPVLNLSQILKNDPSLADVVKDGGITQEDLDKFSKERLFKDGLKTESTVKLEVDGATKTAKADKETDQKARLAASARDILDEDSFGKDDNVNSVALKQAELDASDEQRKVQREKDNADQDLSDSEDYRMAKAQRNLLEAARKGILKSTTDFCAALIQAPGNSYEDLPESLKNGQCQKSEDETVVAEREADARREKERKFVREMQERQERIKEQEAKGQKPRFQSASGAPCGPERQGQALNSMNNNINNQVGGIFNQLQTLPMSGMCGRAEAEATQKQIMYTGLTNEDPRMILMAAGPTFFNSSVEEAISSIPLSDPNKGAKLDEALRTAGEQIEALNWRLARIPGGSNNPSYEAGQLTYKMQLCLAVAKRIATRRDALAGTAPMVTPLNSNGSTNALMSNGLATSGSEVQVKPSSSTTTTPANDRARAALSKRRAT